MHPWRDIWTQPRSTIQYLIANNPSYGFKRLAWLYGFTTALGFCKMFSLIATYPLWVILLASLLLGIVVGVIAITIIAYVLEWCGRLIGGNATFKQVRCVVAWSNLPILINLFTWILMIGVFKERAFYADFPTEVTLANKTGLFLIVMLGQWVVSIWCFIILIQGLREVHGFSVWKALLNVIIPLIVLIALSALMTEVISWFITKTQ